MLTLQFGPSEAIPASSELILHSFTETFRAASVRMTRCSVRRQETERRSSKTGQFHSIGGFVGVAEYEGDLAEFLPYLEAGRWTGVGRQSVWGKGEIIIEAITN